MNIESIETADCHISEGTIEENRVTFVFNRLYDTLLEKYVKNAILVIKDWSTFSAKIFISESPFSKPLETELENESIQVFDLIQELIINDNCLKLSGFSKESGHWMEYEFTNYEYEIIIEGN